MEKPILAVRNFPLTTFKDIPKEAMYPPIATVNIQFYHKYICKTSQLFVLACL